MYLLAVDPGRNTGYAVLRNANNLAHYGTIKTKDNRRTVEPEVVLIKDFTALMDRCRAMCDYEGEKDRHIVIEDTFIGVNKKIAQLIIEAKSTIKSIGISAGFEAHEIMATTWQSKMGFKHGKQPINKNEIWHWVKGTYPYFFGDEHAASAICAGVCWIQLRWEEFLLNG